MRSTETRTLNLNLRIAHKIHQGRKIGDFQQFIVDPNRKIKNPPEITGEGKGQVTMTLIEFMVDNNQTFHIVNSGAFSIMNDLEFIAFNQEIDVIKVQVPNSP